MLKKIIIINGASFNTLTSRTEKNNNDACKWLTDRQTDRQTYLHEYELLSLYKQYNRWGGWLANLCKFRTHVKAAAAKSKEPFNSDSARPQTLMN